MNVSCETDDNCPLKKVCSKEGKCISIREAHVNDPPEWCKNKICKVQTLKGDDWMGPGKTDDPCRRMITEENCNKTWVQIDKKHNTLNNIDMGKECYWNKSFKMCETPQVGPKPINELCTQDACDYKSLSPIDGCMVEKAGNFDPFATETINSKCDYYGCMVKETSKGNVSINYDEKATKDPGDMCTIIGCMDKSAANYDPDATTEYVKGHP